MNYLIKFTKRIAFIFKFWRFLPFLKDFFLTTEVKIHKKVLGVLMILTYVFFPFDLIPDYLAFLGIIDDLVIATFVLERFIKIAPESLKEKYNL
ncbi:DUF1232 domain-containing protein [Cytobacillus sp. S13-E01]|uniref:YkvA family protein n=1 Tax=Cytobacillus sp. S13-E01 TaxID=3031326 RepID=UPI0031F306E8